jgi:Pentapeptide repeats (8 copies)
MSSSSRLSFANQDLRNCSFRQQYLRDADFSGADIRGCNFNGANLTGANFGHIRSGLSHKQIVTLTICTVGFVVAYADALAFALTGSFVMAVAISLASSVLAALTSPFALSLVLCALAGVIVNISGDNWEFSVAIAIGFSLAIILNRNRTLIAIFIGAIAFSFMVATVFGFAGNLAITLTTPFVYSVGILFGGIVAFIVVDSDRDFYDPSATGRFMLVAATSGNCLVVAALAIAIAHRASLDNNLLIELAYLLFAIAAIACGLKFGIKAIQGVREAVGTSFQDANLTGARFDYAVMSSTDFSGAKLSQVSWTRARMRNCFARSI